MVMGSTVLELFLPNNLSRPRVEFLPAECSADQQVREVARFGFSLCDVTSVMSICNAGILSANYLVETGNRRFVLKARSIGGGVAERMTQEIELALRLSARGLLVPHALLTHNNNYIYEAHGSVWACFRFCAGNYFQGHPGELEVAASNYAALTLALREEGPSLGEFAESKLIDKLTSMVRATTNPPDYDPTMAVLYKRYRDELLHVLDHVSKVQESLEAQCQVMHTDFHPLNVLMNNGQVSAMLDFEDVKPYPVAAASGFAAYKLMRQSMVVVPRELRFLEAERMVNCWLTEWSKLFDSQALDRRKLGMGALYRVIGLLHLMFDAWLRQGDSRFNFDFQKQMSSLREISFIFDLRL